MIDHGRVIAHDTPDGLKRVVGGQTLTVRPADADAPRRGRARSSASSPAPRPTRRAAAPSACPSPATRCSADAVARLTDAGIAVTELSLHLPSLDEVFFTLTGRTAELQEARMTAIAAQAPATMPASSRPLRCCATASCSPSAT